MSEPVDLDAIRAQRAVHSDEVSPRAAVAQVLHEIDSGALDPEHVIVVLHTEAATHYRQAGSGNRIVQLGMMFRVMNMLDGR